MKVPSYPLNSGAERKEEIVNEQAQAKPAAYSPKTNKKDMTGAVESLNEASSLTAKNKAYLDSSNTAQTNSAHNKDKEVLEEKYNHISSSQKPAADRPRSLLGNILLRGNQHHQAERVNNQSATATQQIAKEASNKISRLDKILDTVAIKSKQGFVNVYNNVGEALQPAYNKIEKIPGKALDVARVAYGTVKIIHNKRGEITNMAQDTAQSLHDSRHELEALSAEGANFIKNVTLEHFNQQLLDLKRRLSNGMSEHAAPPNNMSQHAEKLNDIQRRAIDMASTKYHAFKDKYSSDIPMLSKESIDLIKRNSSNFADAQKLFSADSEVMKALALAGAEEYNRNFNVANELTNHIQDNYIKTFGKVMSYGEILRPDIGPFNISTKSARLAINNLQSSPIAHSPEMQEIFKICETEAGLARYLLTERGAIMIGTAIMMPHVVQLAPYISENMKEVKATAKEEAIKMKNANIAQHLANLWRQGDTRMKIIQDNKLRAEAAGASYYLKHGYNDPKSANYQLHLYNYGEINEALDGFLIKRTSKND